MLRSSGAVDLALKRRLESGRLADPDVRVVVARHPELRAARRLAALAERVGMLGRYDPSVFRHDVVENDRRLERSRGQLRLLAAVQLAATAAKHAAHDLLDGVLEV